VSAPADLTPPPRRVRWARAALVAAAWLFAAALLAQIYLAGRAVFIGPGNWERHKDFVHTFEWLSPVAVLLAYLARAPRAVKGLAWLTVAQLFLQYTFADLRLDAARKPWAPLHPVNGVLLFWTATELARRATRTETR
jgi:mercuric ion transport protein